MKSFKLNSIVSESDAIDMKTLFSEDIKDKKNFRFGWASFPPGSRVPKEGMAAHDGDEYALIVNGTATISVNGITRKTTKGDVSCISAGEPHYTLNDSLDKLEVVWILLE